MPSERLSSRPVAVHGGEGVTSGLGETCTEEEAFEGALQNVELVLRWVHGDKEIPVTEKQ